MKSYLPSTIKLFKYYKSLGEKTMSQVPDEQLFWQYNEESNSLATIVKHLHGNMLSRWTDFLNADGEKDWRQRDAEFENDLGSKEAIVQLWEEGWTCLLDALDQLSDADLDKTIYIRNMGHTVTEAINRQLAHYSYHIGQMVFIGKMTQNESWDSLSIPKNQSTSYNKEKFTKAKSKKFFTDDL